MGFAVYLDWMMVFLSRFTAGRRCCILSLTLFLLFSSFSHQNLFLDVILWLSLFPGTLGCSGITGEKGSLDSVVHMVIAVPLFQNLIS